MLAGHFGYELGVSAQRALATGAALPERVSAELPIVLYGASLTGDTLALGRYQHEEQALGVVGDSSRWLRRASGGVTVRAGAGVVYAALALNDRSSLLQCPPGRLLNRNVRGALQGLRQLGLSINYFGRDFLSLGTQPVCYVGWDARDTGQILLELFVAHASPWFVSDDMLAYPPRSLPALHGKLPTTIEETRADIEPKRLLEAIAEGHSRAFGVDWTDLTDLPGAAVSAALPTRTLGSDHRLVWSTPREEAIGFVGAGVCLDDRGKFAAVRLVGDFFAHRACAVMLEQRLLGTSPSPQEVGAAVDAAFTRAGYDVEGVRNLGVFRDAILEASGHYPTPPAAPQKESKPSD